MAAGPHQWQTTVTDVSGADDLRPPGGVCDGRSAGKDAQPVGGGEARRVITDLGEEATSESGPDAGSGAKELGVIVSPRTSRSESARVG
jgi:hypothetical protein